MAYTTNVPSEARHSYSALKEALLAAMGMSREHCERIFWSQTVRPNDSPIEKITELQAITHVRTLHVGIRLCKSYGCREIPIHVCLGRCRIVRLKLPKTLGLRQCDAGTP